MKMERGIHHFWAEAGAGAEAACESHAELKGMRELRRRTQHLRPETCHLNAPEDSLNIVISTPWAPSPH